MLLSYLQEHYGDLASVIGLLVTFGGFIATIRKVREAERAAQEARRAANEAVSRIKAQLLMDEVSAAIQLVRSLDSACRERDWPKAITDCDEGRTRLAMLSGFAIISEAEKEVVRNGVNQLGEILPFLQRQRSSSTPKELPPQKSKYLHEIITTLSHIHGRLRTETLEV